MGSNGRIRKPVTVEERDECHCDEHQRVKMHARSHDAQPAEVEYCAKCGRVHAMPENVAKFKSLHDITDGMTHTEALGKLDALRAMGYANTAELAKVAQVWVERHERQIRALDTRIRRAQKKIGMTSRERQAYIQDVERLNYERDNLHAAYELLTYIQSEEEPDPQRTAQLLQKANIANDGAVEPTYTDLVQRPIAVDEESEQQPTRDMQTTN